MPVSDPEKNPEIIMRIINAVNKTLRDAWSKKRITFSHSNNYNGETD
jgi:hypothetical protein